MKCLRIEVMRKIFAMILCSLCCVGTTAQSVYTLTQLKDSALQHNNAVLNAQQNISIAQEQRKEAYTHYFPSVSGTGMWFNANKGMAKMDMNPSEMISPELGMALSQTLPPEALAALGNPMSMTMMKNGTIASLTATQPLFAGGQIVRGNQLAKVGEEVSRIQLRQSVNEVEKTTEAYYWQLVSLQEKVRTLDAVDSLLANLYKDVSVAVKAGVALRNDLLQVQLRQNDIASQRVKLMNGISLVKLLTAQYCGLADHDFTIVYDEYSGSPEMPKPMNEEGKQSSLSLLPEYQLLEKQVEATDLQRKMAFGQNLPTVAVGAGYNYHNLLGNDRTFGMVFATVSIPISDWWGGSHTVKRKKMEHQKAIDQLTDNAELLMIRMQKTWNDVEEARQQLTIADKSIEQAAENLRLNQNYYQAGTCRMSDLLEAQLLYQQALDKRTELFADYQNRLLEYRQAIGER
ncbi:MAG: TolC family protein [Prevotella sp.]|nr:TolC family protein [Prevotella sp.]